ncbi:MAG: 3-methylcrotonyl-CoA carboxylase [Legionella sp.]|nr:MAG: 3-methylcrotonyl-CoA carboxylase [Legionella sp.]PJD98662.1 MAG: 3-methylcrotonyl-CoA carboxylase [Legionella sp.]
MFNKILIANRGEIACRIIRTARKMGIHCVAIYSSADKNSLHVQEADSAYWIGEAPSKDSYLNKERIIQVALESGAQAIHPGYGFLSENPDFASACQKAGIVFIGPSVSAMEAMASKQVAKQLLESTSVPLTPGYHGEEQSYEYLLEQAKIIGFPVLLKAANGGGGKGMRSVYSAEEFQDALLGAKRESMASFADDTMIIEKLILNPRHIEIQIMADHFGNVVHLYERDCSIQRRHQKIIEEAPAPGLSPMLREKMTQAACEVAKAIQYQGAGTIEFLVSDEHFYFMEMNTRLQVEHPVTESVTGLDLVAWQLHIAANQPLPLQQNEIHIQGHAIECRIYAEDPERDFIPSIGVLAYLKEPKGDGVRIDTGIKQHSAITQYYDPMIAKLITRGESREEALHRMIQALKQYCIFGVKTNLSFLLAICQHQQFIKAQLSTGFLVDHDVYSIMPDLQSTLLMVVAFDYCMILKQMTDPLFLDAFAWQNQQTNSWTWRYQYNDKQLHVKVMPQNITEFTVEYDQQLFLVSAKLNGESLSITINKHHHQVTVYNQEDACTVYTEHGPLTIHRFLWDANNQHQIKNKEQLTAPMPSTLVSILKNKGDQVCKGDLLLVLEAMKMEHSIHAPADGTIEEIFYEIGTQVDEGALLLQFKEVP